MRFWGNLIGYQLVWFATVIGAGRGQWWPAVAAAAVFVAWQLSLSNQRLMELRLVAAAVAVGVLFDGGLAASGQLDYAADAISLPSGGAPVWILALWCAFALTLNQSLRWLQPRPWRSALFGGIGGPLAYLAARGFSAVSFVGGWQTLLWLAIGWAVAIPLLMAMITRWSPQRHHTALSAGSVP